MKANTDEGQADWLATPHVGIQTRQFVLDQKQRFSLSGLGLFSPFIDLRSPTTLHFVLRCNTKAREDYSWSRRRQHAQTIKFRGAYSHKLSQDLAGVH
jgi:hypothetical protein